MILSDTAIRRPVFTTMVIAAIVVFGMIGVRAIGIDLLPKVEFPYILIVSVLPGADPATVETTVSDPIEEAVFSISGIKNLRSVSTDSVSQIVLEFELEKDVDVAYQEVQAKLGTVRSLLPKDLEDPVVDKFDPDSAPILSVVVSGDKPIRELTRLADKLVKPRLQTVANVAQVKLVGGRDRQIWILLDRSRLEGYALSVADVERALETEHIEFPGGRVETGTREYLVKTKAEFTSAQEMENLVVAFRQGSPIRVRDVGRVEDGLEEERSLGRLDGKQAIALLVRRQSGTNTVAVAHGVKQVFASLKEELAPRGIKLEIAQDMSTYIEHSIEEIEFHLVFGGLLAVIIVFLFLRNLRITLISAIAIPTSVVGTILLINAMGFTLNMMTMLALSLSIGLLIDDAIVVVENIYRHNEMGKNPLQAAHFATGEIGLAVFAITMSIVAVFVPVAFMKGVIGRFFYQFGMTVTFAVLISLFVSFTLTPMLASRFLRVSPADNPLFRLLGRRLDAVDGAYRRLLAAALDHRVLTLLLAVGTFVFSLFIARFLDMEFTPKEDQSEFAIAIKAPLGSPLSYTDRVMETIRQRLVGQPWLSYTFGTIGADSLQRVNEGSIYVKMKDKGTREMSQEGAIAWARETLAHVARARITVTPVNRMGGGLSRSFDLQVALRGPDLAQLEKYSNSLVSKVAEADGYRDVESSYEKGKPELDVYLSRARAADLGVSAFSVASTVRSLIGGNAVSKFRAEGDRYDISVRLEETFRNRPGAVEEVQVRTARGNLVRVGNLASVREESGPVQIDRNNRSRQISVLANLVREKKILGQAIEDLTGMVKALDLPPGYSYKFEGMADIMRESFGYLFFALFLAVLLVFMVLCSQFESFLDPLSIMLSLPLAVVGALGALVLTGATMTIFNMIGIIMLMGLVTKNAILLVDFTNTLRTRDGMERNAALLQAGPIRLRPILMTTFAMIFGMLPIALGTGSGSESRSPMAIAVIGGLVTSTLLTLVVVPVVYTYLDDLKGVFRRLWPA